MLDNLIRKARKIKISPVNRVVLKKSEELNTQSFKHTTYAKPKDKGECYHKEWCIIWYCRYIHPEARQEECECTMLKCNKLHKRQAICKNPNHRDGCTMSHTKAELIAKLKN